LRKRKKEREKGREKKGKKRGKVSTYYYFNSRRSIISYCTFFRYKKYKIDRKRRS
jgi:hypothetical protein